MRAWKMLYVLCGLMAAVLCVLPTTPRATAVAHRAAGGSSANASSSVASRLQVATGSLARLAADLRHSRGNTLVRQLNSGESPRSSAASRPIRGSYARLAAVAERMAAADWVERFIVSGADTRLGPKSSSARAARLRGDSGRRQPLGAWIGWSGCAPYAARRDHLGRPVQTVARASVSFRSPPASPRGSGPVVVPAPAPSRQR